MAPEQVDVLVVGAGPTGLSAAVALAQAGVDVAVVERDAGPIEQSRAVWVHPRTVELWSGIGIADDALAHGRLLERIDIHVYRRRRATLWYDGTDRTPYPQGLILEQSVTQRLLLARLRQLSQAPRWRHAVTSVEPDGDGVHVAIDRLDEAGGVVASGVVRARYVIGADGASSTVRDQIGLRLEGGTYASSFFSADLVMDVPYERSRAHMSLTLDQTHAFLPMPGERRWRVVGNFTRSQERRYGQGAGPTGSGSLGIDDVEELLANLRVAHAVERVEWATVYRSHHRLVDRYRVGRVLLAGDAAHIHSPAGGLGMNTGIGDALNLAWKVADVVNGHAVDALLDTYEAERRPVAQQVLRVSDRIFNLQAGTGRAISLLRVLVLPLIPRLLGLTAAGRRLAFGVLSQTGVTYRDAVTTRAAGGGRLRAGDRLPFARLGDGRTTHDLIDGQRHAVVVIDGDADTSTAVREALDAVELPVDLHVVADSPALRTGLGTDGPVVLLLRPDGHVDHIGVDAASLGAHLRRWYAVTPRVRPGAGGEQPA